jgi:hypothetical protein
MLSKKLLNFEKKRFFYWIFRHKIQNQRAKRVWKTSQNSEITDFKWTHPNNITNKWKKKNVISANIGILFPFRSKLKFWFSIAYSEMKRQFSSLAFDEDSWCGKHEHKNIVISLSSILIIKFSFITTKVKCEEYTLEIPVWTSHKFWAGNLTRNPCNCNFYFMSHGIPCLYSFTWKHEA